MFIGLFDEPDGYQSCKWRRVSLLCISHVAYLLLIFMCVGFYPEPRPCRHFVLCEHFQSMTESKQNALTGLAWCLL